MKNGFNNYVITDSRLQCRALGKDYFMHFKAASDKNVTVTVLGSYSEVITGPILLFLTSLMTIFFS